MTTEQKIDVVHVDDNDLSILRKAHKGKGGPSPIPPRKAGGNTVKSRSLAEKPRHLDGRKFGKQKAEREVPLNVDVPQEIKELVVRVRQEYGMPMKAFVANAIEHYWRFLELEVASGGTTE